MLGLNSVVNAAGLACMGPQGKQKVTENNITVRPAVDYSVKESSDLTCV